jgi:hypothetical protein
MKKLWRSDTAFLLAILMVLGTEWSEARNYCPAALSAKASKCICTVKSKGLVIICEKASMDDVKESMRIYKEIPGAVIQYLTLRQTNMPKIPDYVFMGKRKLIPTFDSFYHSTIQCDFPTRDSSHHMTDNLVFIASLCI